MAEKLITALKRAKSPGAAGVSPAAIAALIDDFNQNDVEVHSLMILRGGKVAYEDWAEPYAPDIPHTMYSVSKSVTATAVGFAVEEGILSLDTKVIDVFPEYRPAKRDENLENLTVLHLLTMTAGKDVSTFADKTKDRWVQDFFDAKWAFAPGEFWRYISDNTFMLSAILQRLTGQPMTDYLMPRLFEPLGFGRKPFWEKDAYGVEAGGWGLFLTTEELAKFILCYRQGGVYEGRQVIPAAWAGEAVKKQVENLQYEEPACTAGYGYGFWRNPLENSYRADGLFSQFGMVFEDYDACLIMTAGNILARKSRDCIWRHIPALFEPNEDEKAGLSEDLPRLRSLPDLDASPRSKLEKAIDGKILNLGKKALLDKIGMPVGMLTSPVLQMNREKLGNIEQIRFRFKENECEMTWREALYKNTIACGMDGKARRSEIRMSQFRFTAHSTAAWENENTLCVWMRPLESIGQRRLKFVFGDDGKVDILPGSMPEAKDFMEYLSSYVGYFVKNEFLVNSAKKILSKADRVIEPRHSGKVKKR